MTEPRTEYGVMSPDGEISSIGDGTGLRTLAAPRSARWRASGWRVMVREVGPWRELVESEPISDDVPAP